MRSELRLVQVMLRRCGKLIEGLKLKKNKEQILKEQSDKKEELDNLEMY